MKKAAPAILIALVLLVAPACGGQDEESATITANIAEAIATEGGILTSEQADCVAKKFVDEMGVEELEEAQVVTEDGSYNDNGANVDSTTSAVYAESLLSCVEEDEALEKIEEILVEGSAGASIPAENAKCYVSKLIENVELKQLLASKIVSDSGELSENAASPDPDTAAKSTAALLSCVDYYALDTAERASQNEDLSAAKYSACLRKRLTEDLLSKFLTAVQAQTADARKLSVQVSEITATCTTSATKK